MSPIGVVCALGVVGPGGAGVVFGGLGERGEPIVLRGAGRGQNAFVGRCSVFVLIFPTARRAVRGVIRGILVLSLALHYWTRIR